MDECLAYCSLQFLGVGKYVVIHVFTQIMGAVTIKTAE